MTSFYNHPSRLITAKNHPSSSANKNAPNGHVMFYDGIMTINAKRSTILKKVKQFENSHIKSRSKILTINAKRSKILKKGKKIEKGKKLIIHT